MSTKVTYVCGSAAGTVRARLSQHVEEVWRDHGYDAWVVVGPDELKRAIGKIVGTHPFEEMESHPPALELMRAIKFSDPDVIVLATEPSAWEEGREDLSFWRTLPETALWAAASGHLVFVEIVVGSVGEAVRMVSEGRSRRFMWEELVVCEFDGEPFDLCKEVDGQTDVKRETKAES